MESYHVDQTQPDLLKNSVYGRYWISRPMQIVAPIHFFLAQIFFWRGSKKNLFGVVFLFFWRTNFFLEMVYKFFFVRGTFFLRSIKKEFWRGNSLPGSILPPFRGGVFFENFKFEDNDKSVGLQFYCSNHNKCFPPQFPPNN